MKSTDQPTLPHRDTCGRVGDMHGAPALNDLGAWPASGSGRPAGAVKGRSERRAARPVLLGGPGALRDMVQNHLLQVLAFVAMEPPDSLAPEDVRDRTAELLPPCSAVLGGRTHRGQYVAGVVEGHEVPAYRDEGRVAPESTVETFVALRAWIDIARWLEVPFFLRTATPAPPHDGSHDRPARAAATAVRGRRHRAPARTPPGTPRPARRGHIAGLQGQRARSRDGADAVPMDFTYGSSFKTQSAEAYERLLHDAMTGDQTLFLRQDAVGAPGRSSLPYSTSPSPRIPTPREPGARPPQPS